MRLEVRLPAILAGIASLALPVAAARAQTPMQAIQQQQQQQQIQQAQQAQQALQRQQLEQQQQQAAPPTTSFTAPLTGPPSDCVVSPGRTRSRSGPTRLGSA